MTVKELCDSIDMLLENGIIKQDTNVTIHSIDHGDYANLIGITYYDHGEFELQALKEEE